MGRAVDQLGDQMMERCTFLAVPSVGLPSLLLQADEIIE